MLNSFSLRRVLCIVSREYWLAERITSRYLSQARQELAMRLLARVYAGGPAPSKVSLSRIETILKLTAFT